MFAFLTKNRKGFTIVELMVVLVLLSFGVLALANMFKVTYRAFNKAEERAIKQEAVKMVAETLRSGQTNVASAMSADIFDTTAVICPNKADSTYSYLYFEPHTICSVCKGDWNITDNKCPSSCTGATSQIDGYFIKCLNKGVLPSAALQLSDIPIYIEFEPIRDKNPGATEESNQCGVNITLSALEDDFDYNSGNPPVSDDKYYSLTVSYHFPNMVLAENDIVVNFKGKERVESHLYNTDGTISTTTTTNNADGTVTTSTNTVLSVDKGGVVLRVYSDAIISADSANTSVGVPSLCFIATASYGQDSGEVGLLCDFRDKCLLTNPLGTAFVNAYYKLSPPVADFIRDSEPLKAAVRVALKPLVAIATNALDNDAASQNVPWFILFMLCSAGATATLIKVDKRRKADKVQSSKLKVK